MNVTFKDIAVFVDPSPEGDRRLRFAAAIAERHSARLTGIYVAREQLDPHPCYTHVRGRHAIASMIQDWLRLQRCRTHQSSRRFSDLLVTERLGTDFRVVWKGSEADRRITLNSLLADIVVIDQQPPYGLPEHWLPEHLLSASGVPLLVVPTRGPIETKAERIVVGWNATKESRRAIADAMPLLVSARSVILLAVDCNDDSHRYRVETGIDMVLHLARHGVRATFEHITLNGMSVTKALLSGALNRGADLVVMGAFSHAKLIQVALGGVTRSMFSEMTIPVLMSR